MDADKCPCCESPTSAAQLCLFILGTQYLGLGVLRHVFRVRYAVCVLVTVLTFRVTSTSRTRTVALVRVGDSLSKVRWNLPGSFGSDPSSGPTVLEQHATISLDLLGLLKGGWQKFSTAYAAENSLL